MDRPEFKLIEWIQGQVKSRHPVSVGIGDDAAAIRFDHQRDSLIATDMLMEGVHFTFPPATPELAGRKALAVNLSDIAAMGGRAIAAFISIAIPQNRGMSFAQDVHRGVLDLANEFDVVVAGGDTNSWKGPLVINVAIVGETLRERPILRSGAQPGDWLFVTGDLGGSLGGKHLNFQPRLREVITLLEECDPRAMIDVSDGLAADLHHILNQSHVGAILDSSRIPISQAAQQQATAGRTALDRALSDGEDFELLFTVSPEDGSRLTSNWRESTPLTWIGEVTVATGCWLKSSTGDCVELPPLGWTHSV